MSLPYFDFIDLAALLVVIVILVVMVILICSMMRKIERHQDEVRVRRITRGTGAIHTGINRKIQTDLTATDMEELRRKTMVHLPSYDGQEVTRIDQSDRWNKIHPTKWKDPWKDEFIISDRQVFTNGYRNDAELTKID